MMTLKSVTEMRNREPVEHGEICFVTEYSSGSKMGGGLFVHDPGDTQCRDDHGMTLVSPKGARWKRQVNDLNDVTVADFGAIADGKTDCIGAVTQMWNWSQAHCPHIGIQFPAGRFFLSRFDISKTQISHFRLTGKHVNSGYYPATTLVSDKKNDEVMFSVNARYMVISALEIDGENAEKTPNTKGFYKNIITAGQFVRVTGVHFLNLGGRGLDMLDTLDCKIDQWYAKHCSGTVIHASWSNDPHGKWDHITAIELSNFNIQFCTKNPAIDLQRAGQSLIWNGWIEHTEYPGNISNGQWEIHALNIETCPHPLECHYSRVLNSQFDQQNGEGLDFSETGPRWEAISEYEAGSVRTENHGISINGSLNYAYLTSPDKMDNRSDKEKWFYVGEIFHSQNTVQTKIRLLGSAAFNRMPSTQTSYSDRTPEGSAEIYIQKINDAEYIGSWIGQGSVPVTRVLLQPGSSKQKIKLYVKLARYTGYCTAIVETNDHDRFEKGIHFRFYKAYSAATPDVVQSLDHAADNCFHQHWSGSAGVGFGFNNDNELLVKGKVLDTHQFGTANHCLKVLIDGKAYGLELKPLKSG